MPRSPRVLQGLVADAALLSPALPRPEGKLPSGSFRSDDGAQTGALTPSPTP